MVVGIVVSGFGYYSLKKDSLGVSRDAMESIEKNKDSTDTKMTATQEIQTYPASAAANSAPSKSISNDSLLPCASPTATNCGKQTAELPAKVTGGYAFVITGSVHDLTDAPAMTSGRPLAGVVIRSVGPKAVIAETKADGSYSLSFSNAPLGVYEVCITLPPGFRVNLPSGCEIVTVRLSEKYIKTLEFINNGNAALNGTAIRFDILRQESASQSSNSDEPPLKLKSMGINIDYYDSSSNKAGDFLFTKQNLQFNRLFMGYGFFIPSSSASPDKYNPQPTFILPLGTPVRSLVDGVVVNMPILWSGDYSIQVTENGKLEKWIYETEHIINPTVQIGDTVKAGQIVGEVSNFDKGTPSGFGTVEIGILKGGKAPQHVCPFAYLDPSIKQEMEKKIIAFYKDWEEYTGNQTLHDEFSNTPGCLTLEPIEG